MINYRSFCKEIFLEMLLSLLRAQYNYYYSKEFIHVYGRADKKDNIGADIVRNGLRSDDCVFLDAAVIAGCDDRTDGDSMDE